MKQTLNTLITSCSSHCVPISVCAVKSVTYSIHIVFSRCSNHVNTRDKPGERFELEHQMGRVCTNITHQELLLIYSVLHIFRVCFILVSTDMVLWISPVGTAATSSSGAAPPPSERTTLTSSVRSGVLYTIQNNSLACKQIIAASKCQDPIMCKCLTFKVAGAHEYH